MPQAQVPYFYMQQVLWAGYGLDFQSTSDQALTKCYNGSECIITDIIARHRSGGGSISCLGGVYDGSSKGGNALVAATQSWLTLSSGVIVKASLAAIAGSTLITSQALYLSLTTGSLAACRGDLFVLGIDVT